MPKTWHGAVVASGILYVLWYIAFRAESTRSPEWPSTSGTERNSTLAAQNVQMGVASHYYVHRGLTLVNTTSLFDWYEATLDRSHRSLLRHAVGRNAYGSRVIPFYYRKTDTFKPDVVTLITWLTADRLGRLVRLAEKRRAPLSVAYFIPSNPRLATRHLALLDRLYATHPALSSNVDIHLVTSDFKLQLNTWRNVARIFSGTDYILLWDIDFEACTDYQRGFDEFRRAQARRGNAGEVEAGKAALVIPAFEWTELVTPRKQGLCPASKQQLHRLFEDLKMDAFESYNPVLSHACDYPQFFASGPADYYPVEDFEFGYEAYMILRADAPIWFDERFLAMGWDRSAFTAHLYLSGMSLYVLPDQWAVHQEHPAFQVAGNGVPIDDGGNERAWHSFRMDTCHQYGHILASQGLLHREPGERLIHICADDEEEYIFREMQRLLGISTGVEADREDGITPLVDAGFA